MSNLKEILLKANKNGYAVPAFNIFNYTSAKAVLNAAQELRSPLIIQTSVKTVKEFGAKNLISILKLLIKSYDIPVITHLDHCTKVNFAKECIDAGFDSIMIDASSLPIDENIRITKEIKEYAAKKGVTVEGELGVIKGVEDDILSDVEIKAGYTESIKYINETGIDAFAPAVGTAHGLYSGKPKIEYNLVDRLNKKTNCPIVIHGGSGLSGEVFKKLIKLGATKINISTAIKRAYVDSLKEFLNKNPKLYNPLKIDNHVENAIKQTAKDHIKLFGSDRQIVYSYNVS